MARISSYNLDSNVTKTDKVIGTDSAGNITKNFNLEDIANFLNTSSLINVNGQLVYQFKELAVPGGGQFVTSSGVTQAFSAITSLLFSHTNTNNQNIQQYIEYFEGLYVMLTQTDNQNNFGQYSVDSITDSGSGYSTFAVSFREGNGSLVQDKYYAMSFSPKGQTDKHLTWPTDGSLYQFIAGEAVPITHNLNKFPSVTTVDSAGSHLVGDVQHINNNSFNVTFSAPFQGKIYIN
jgi:hypothetical protein